MADDLIKTSQSPAEQGSGAEVVSTEDALYLKMVGISNRLIDFYDLISSDSEESEEFFRKYPKTAEAKLRIAPVAFSRIMPSRRTLEPGPPAASRRLNPADIVKLGLSQEKLKDLAGIEEK
jgi:hypothetical protein|tara:strand:+ start:2779 stop:3141 length:363 start_codon:yes stop_codon:yes gene_type:complete